MYTQTRTKPGEFRAMTGLNIDEFDALIPSFEDAWITCMQTTTMEGNRRWCRTYTTYRNSRFLSSAEKLFFVLVYLKQAPTQTLLATLFGITQPSANRWIQRTLTALRAALALHHVLPARDIETLNDFLHRDAEAGGEIPTLFFMMEQNDR